MTSESKTDTHTSFNLSYSLFHIAARKYEWLDGEFHWLGVEFINRGNPYMHRNKSIHPKDVEKEMDVIKQILTSLRDDDVTDWRSSFNPKMLFHCKS